jgi:putative hemolysin
MEIFKNQALTLAIFFLVGLGFLTAFMTALLKLGKYKSRERLVIKTSRLFFFRYILFRLFQNREWADLYFSISTTKNILNLLYVSTAFFYSLGYLGEDLLTNSASLLFFTIIIIAVSIFVDFVMRLLGNAWPTKGVRFFSFVSSIYLTLFCPITFVLLKLTKAFSSLNRGKEKETAPFSIKQKMNEILVDTKKHLDPYDQKLLSSFITFRERVAREIMIPRIDLCALPCETTIKDAGPLFIKEGYSRIPVYKDTLDHIIGVIIYKDFLKVYSSEKTDDVELVSPVEKILKPVIYAPENKKISHLLQEFKAKQIHLAIIVNEYGGTEGIVTIEDILEELVGEIEDEHDVDDDQKFWKLPEGSYVVNAKMSIVDIEDELNIKLPHHPEYETIGGFVFHKAGTIPKKGWSIHLEEMKLEVLSSDERSVKKILITLAK